MGETLWLLSLQLHSFFQWLERLPLLSHSQHTCQPPALTQREQVYYTDVQGFFSASVVRSVHVYLPCGCYPASLGVSQGVPWPIGLSLSAVADVFPRWCKNPPLCCDPSARLRVKSPVLSRFCLVKSCMYRPNILPKS